MSYLIVVLVVVAHGPRILINPRLRSDVHCPTIIPLATSPAPSALHMPWTVCNCPTGYIKVCEVELALWQAIACARPQAFHAKGRVASLKSTRPRAFQVEILLETQDCFIWKMP